MCCKGVTLTAGILPRQKAAGNMDEEKEEHWRFDLHCNQAMCIASRIIVLFSKHIWKLL